jgi:hypothetical protein
VPFVSYDEVFFRQRQHITPPTVGIATASTTTITTHAQQQHINTRHPALPAEMAIIVTRSSGLFGKVGAEVGARKSHSSSTLNVLKSAVLEQNSQTHLEASIAAGLAMIHFTQASLSRGVEVHESGQTTSFGQKVEPQSS